MARSEIPLNTLAFQGGDASLTTISVSAVDGHYFVNDGNTLLFIFDLAAGATAVATVVSVDDPFGRQEDLSLTTLVGDMSVGGPFIPAIWNQGGGNQINVDVDITNANVLLAAVKFSPIK